MHKPIILSLLYKCVSVVVSDCDCKRIDQLRSNIRGEYSIMIDQFLQLHSKKMSVSI